MADYRSVMQAIRGYDNFVLQKIGDPCVNNIGQVFFENGLLNLKTHNLRNIVFGDNKLDNHLFTFIDEKDFYTVKNGDNEFIVAKDMVKTFVVLVSNPDKQWNENIDLLKILPSLFLNVLGIKVNFLNDYGIINKAIGLAEKLMTDRENIILESLGVNDIFSEKNYVLHKNSFTCLKKLIETTILENRFHNGDYCYKIKSNIGKKTSIKFNIECGNSMIYDRVYPVNKTTIVLSEIIEQIKKTEHLVENFVFEKMSSI